MSSGILSVSQAARAVGEITGAPKPHQSVIRRWITKGARGNKLAARQVGGKYYVERLALIKFLSAKPNTDTTQNNNAELAINAMLGRQAGAQEIAKRGLEKTGSTQKVENVASVIEAGIDLGLLQIKSTH